MKNKLIMTVSLIGLLFPLNIKALTGSVNLNCDSNVVTVNTSTKCTLSGNSSEGISALSAKLSANGSISIANISTSTIWQGNGEGGNIDLYTDSNKSGGFAIATFTIQASAIAGSGTINVSNISFSDSSFVEHFILDKSITITVKEIEKPKEDNNIQNNKPANNNQKPTVSQNNNEQSQKEETEDENKKSSNATLKSLILDQATINFSKEVTDYNIEVTNNIKKISISAEPMDVNAKVTIPKNLDLNLGMNNFEIKVVAEDGTEKIYKLHINRLEKVLSSNSKLKSLKIEGYKLSFEGNNYIYDLMDINTSTLKIKAIPEDENAKIEIYGNNSIGKKDSVVIKVIAEDETTSEYIIYANNTKSSNISISFISILILSIISLGLNIFFVNKKLTKSKNNNVINK